MSDKITLTDEETGMSVSLPLPAGTSILSPAGRAVLLVAESMLDQMLAAAVTRAASEDRG